MPLLGNFFHRKYQHHTFWWHTSYEVNASWKDKLRDLWHHPYMHGCESISKSDANTPTAVSLCMLIHLRVYPPNLGLKQIRTALRTWIYPLSFLLWQILLCMTEKLSFSLTDPLSWLLFFLFSHIHYIINHHKHLTWYMQLNRLAAHVLAFLWPYDLEWTSRSFIPPLPPPLPLSAVAFSLNRHRPNWQEIELRSKAFAIYDRHPTGHKWITTKIHM